MKYQYFVIPGILVLCIIGIVVIRNITTTKPIPQPIPQPLQVENSQQEQNSQQAENIQEEHSGVPLPTEEDIIRLFFTLINEKRIPEAVDMMNPKTAGTDSQKQAWGVEFNAFNKVEVKSVSKEEEDGLYRVVLEVKMKPESVNAVIPYFGFGDGENTRWIQLEKINGIYKIGGIATGR